MDSLVGIFVKVLLVVAAAAGVASLTLLTLILFWPLAPAVLIVGVLPLTYLMHLLALDESQS